MERVTAGERSKRVAAKAFYTAPVRHLVLPTVEKKPWESKPRPGSSPAVRPSRGNLNSYGGGSDIFLIGGAGFGHGRTDRPGPAGGSLLGGGGGGGSDGGGGSRSRPSTAPEYALNGGAGQLGARGAGRGAGEGRRPGTGGPGSRRRRRQVSPPWGDSGRRNPEMPSASWREPSLEDTRGSPVLDAPEPLWTPAGVGGGSQFLNTPGSMKGKTSLKKKKLKKKRENVAGGDSRRPRQPI